VHMMKPNVNIRKHNLPERHALQPETKINSKVNYFALIQFFYLQPMS